MNAARWHTQTVELAARDPSVVDTYEGGGFAAPVPIACRFEGHRRLIRARDGREVVSEARIFTLHPLKAGDRITDPSGRSWEVLAVAEMRDTLGRFVQYEARL